MMSPIIEAKTLPMLEPPRLPTAGPSLIVILGASGDLARRKLLPALYDLSCIGCTTGNFHILGVGRSANSDDAFREQMREATRSAVVTNHFNDETWNDFGSKLSYTHGDLNNNGFYSELASKVEEVRNEHDLQNIIYYLSVPPSLAPRIIEGLGQTGLSKEGRVKVRIVVEKPFGRDLKSAIELNQLIAQYFQEHQVYRIDHYLGKETVQNLFVFRFGNYLFEPVWNRNYVDYVEITAAETLGVEGRAGYYEEAGALRDMVANHLLQLLTLTAMEPPVTFEQECVREQKVQVLRSIKPFGPDQVLERTVRGQYGSGELDGKPVPAYREERGVQKESLTETFVALELYIDNWRWAGVPFYIRTGKRLAGNLTEIVVHLKRPPTLIFSKSPDEEISANTIVLRIQPREGISVTFEAKRPGPEIRSSTVRMDFRYETAFGVKLPDAYETLILDVLRGDGTLFTRRDEIEAAWKIITPIHDAWSSERRSVEEYEAGGPGPEAADRLLAKNGHAWRRLEKVAQRRKDG